MNWYFLSVRALLMMLSSEILLKIANEKSVLQVLYKYLLLTASIKTSNSSRTLKGGVIAFQSARIRETLKEHDDENTKSKLKRHLEYDFSPPLSDLISLLMSRAAAFALLSGFTTILSM